MGSTPWGPVAPLGLVASTGAGFALVNATPVFLSWTAPADGQNHRVLLIGELIVSVAETGGACTLTGTAPNGGAISSVIIGGGAAAGYHGLTNNVFSIKSGTTLAIQQTTALTLGAGTVMLEMWAS